MPPRLNLIRIVRAEESRNLPLQLLVHTSRTAWFLFARSRTVATVTCMWVRALGVAGQTIPSR